jgi:GT2 family glycosyltransferase
MTAIILLNWNGWQDTIECLESIYKISTDDYIIITVDNGSSDNSVKYIKNWLEKSNCTFRMLSEGDEITETIINKECIVYSLNDNYGFAKGNNKGIELISKEKVDYYLLLNNDTTVEANFLNELVSFQKLHSEYEVLMPQIRFYNNPDIIWNCGGKIFAGLYRYNYTDVPSSTIKEKEFITITFITGCALFACARLLEDNKLLTERFFFGIEDLDFSMRMKEKSIEMACVLSSKIYHKVNGSVSKIDQGILGMKYYNYLLYFINVKMHYSKSYFLFWKLCYFPYMFHYLRSIGIKFNEIFKLFKFLWIESNRKESVSHEDFNRIKMIGITSKLKK